MRKARLITTLLIALALLLTACNAGPFTVEVGGELPAEVQGRIEDDDAAILYDSERVIATLTWLDGEVLTIVELCHASDRIGDTQYERCDIKAVSLLPDE